MKQIYCDVMLEKFSNKENDIIFSFYDNFGNTLQDIKCKNVMCMNYSNSLPENEDVFPCLVLNVEVELIDPQNISEQLNYMKYGFSLNNNPVIPISNKYWHLIIEGGPIYVEVICSNIIFDK